MLRLLDRERAELHLLWSVLVRPYTLDRSCWAAENLLEGNFMLVVAIERGIIEGWECFRAAKTGVGFRWNGYGSGLGFFISLRFESRYLRSFCRTCRM